MDIVEFLSDYGSTTKHFNSWSNDYTLEVIDHGVFEDVFYRLVVIFVDKIPVMLGLSETKQSNLNFLDILKNAGVTPIGIKLFEPNSGIKRIKPIIGQIDTRLISNTATHDYLVKAKVEGLIYYRESNFVLGNEIMTLKEYILPGLVDILNQYT